MSDLKNRYQAILNELENYFENENDKKFVVDKFQELSMMFMNVIDRITYITDMRLTEVEQKQIDIENKITTVQNAVNGIENDIYEDDEDYEFEIICPYCNYEFVSDIKSEENTEIECPECHNIIELDWNEEEGCGGSCSHCESGCEHSENYKLDNTENNEDDM